MKRRQFLSVAAIPAAVVLTGRASSAQGLEPIDLPKPKTEGGKPLMEVLRDRKSTREFSSQALPQQLLSNLLWAAWGINRPDGRRTAPSARNYQEIGIYVALPEGTYLYEAKAHRLLPVLAGDARAMTGTQEYVATAAVNLVYVADMSGLAKEDADAKALYPAADAAFIAENVYLFCTSENLAVVVRALIDRPALAKKLSLRADQRVILAQSVGYPQK